VARRSVIQGHVEDWDGVRIEVIGPAAPRRPRWRVLNDDSLVQVVRFGEVCFVLAGDVEAAGESALTLPRCDVLKVAHHGSRSSTTQPFLDAVRPRVAVVSVGAGNRFGHPSREVVARARGVGAVVVRTDQDGAVTLSSDGRRLWLSTWANPGEVRLR
jgi:competence protein ComEC